jgi:hypothetical protein
MCRRMGGRGVTRTTGCATPPTRTSQSSSPLRTCTPTRSSDRQVAAASARASPRRCAPGCPLLLPHRLSSGDLGLYRAASLFYTVWLGMCWHGFLNSGDFRAPTPGTCTQGSATAPLRRSCCSAASSGSDGGASGGGVVSGGFLEPLEATR